MEDEEKEFDGGAFRGCMIWIIPALIVWGVIILGVRELLK